MDNNANSFDNVRNQMIANVHKIAQDKNTLIAKYKLIEFLLNSEAERKKIIDKALQRKDMNVQQ